MWKYISKHWKPWLIIIVVLVVLVGAASLWQRKKVAENSTETKLINSPRETTSVQDEFYAEQLTDHELEAYTVLRAALDEYRGGIVEFPNALTGEEYQKVNYALEYGQQDYFYGIIGIPMSEDNRSLSYESQDILTVKEPLVKKCVVFLSCATDVDKSGNFDEEGYVTNLDEVQDSLGTSAEDKIEEIDHIKSETDSILQGIVDQMPKEYGQKEATDYFLKWMEENLTFDEDALYSSSAISNMSEIFSTLRMKTNLPCVIEKKALAAGYARVFANLCNRAGMKAHIVTGSWRDGDAYVMTCVEMDGQDIYVDAAMQQSGDLWNQRYLTGNETKNVLTMPEYFSYGMEE